MTNAQTEARALLETAGARFPNYEEYAAAVAVIATALAAKNAELERRDMQLEASAKVALELSAQLAEANKALERHRSERSYVVGWNDGFAHATSEDLKFPTMLRKMWSGGEVQAWLDEQFAARRAREQGGKNV